MKILVTGTSGQLGHDVCDVLQAEGIPFVGVNHSDCDITDAAAVRGLMEREKPDAVIHCAAFTAVDKAETVPRLAFAVNEAGTRNIAAECRRINAKMVYISTDYVFPGSGSGYYTVDAPKGPLNVYGRSKLAGEQAVQELLNRYFIVRTSWVFGMNGHNFVKTMLRMADQQPRIGVVTDQVGSPTYTVDLALLLCRMIQTDLYGVYHATNEGTCSWAEFAEEIFRQAGKAVPVKPLLTGEYPAAAVRPLNSRLDKSSLDRSGFSRLPDWKDALGRYLKEGLQ